MNLKVFYYSYRNHKASGLGGKQVMVNLINDRFRYRIYDPKRISVSKINCATMAKFEEVIVLALLTYYSMLTCYSLANSRSNKPNL